MQQSTRPSRLALLWTALIAVSAAMFLAAGANASPTDTPAANRAQGLVFDGLVPDETGPCAGAYRVTGVGDGVVRCAHGPDPAPDGVDVTRHRSIEELEAAGIAEGTTSASSSTVPCYGDGVSGKRVQAVYVYAEDVPNRSADVVDLIAGWAGSVDRIFNDSAAKTGGVRHVRWVTGGACKLSVVTVRMSTTGDDSLSKTISELKAAGLDRSDRKYLIWADAKVYCGMATFRSDDQAGTANANESGPSYARVDSGCWGYTNALEAHELMHTFGGVQSSAPHATGAGHCTDEHDRMCYADSSSVVVTYVCAFSNERLFDCGNDDYFHTSPSAGSYLAQHWNAATSSFLARAEPGETEPSGDGGSGDGGSTADSPSSTTTSTWTGSISRKSSSASYQVAVGNGAMTAKLSYNKAKKVTLSVVAADGTTVATGTGNSPISLNTSLAAGTYSLVVAGDGGNASFTLTATYASA